MAGASNTLQEPGHSQRIGIEAGGFFPLGNQIPEVIIGVFEQGLESRVLAGRQTREVALEKSRKDEVQLEHAAPAVPTQTIVFTHGRFRGAER